MRVALSNLLASYIMFLNIDALILLNSEKRKHLLDYGLFYFLQFSVTCCSTGYI